MCKIIQNTTAKITKYSEYFCTKKEGIFRAKMPSNLTYNLSESEEAAEKADSCKSHDNRYNNCDSDNKKV